MNPVVYVSGLHSGPNPSPGIGIARSVRAAYPSASIVGVDYSIRSSGIHWADFDEIWLQRPWDELDLSEYACAVRERLDAGAVWLSGLDLETVWLARTFRSHPNLLVPPTRALDRIVKPPTQAAEALHVRVPEWRRLTISDWEAHSFARGCGWQVWLKAPHYEARRVRSWPSLVSARRELTGTWGESSELFLQEHVPGHEESIALAAHQGRLLACVLMIKRDVTTEGKTWAAEVRDVPTDLRDRLGDVIAALRWTGGAELEFVRDLAGEQWLIEWNPRFPAWIHGATLAGHNLPGLLVQASSQVPARIVAATAGQFARVVIEVPVRTGFPLLPAISDDWEPTASKHPSGMPQLAGRLRQPRVRSSPPAAGLPPEFVRDLSEIDLRSAETPSELFLAASAGALFERAARSIAAAAQNGSAIRIAYSIKTNPDVRLLGLARRSGFLAEAISQSEVKKAIACGFAQSEVILNGPGKQWPVGEPLPVGTLFVDSVEELSALTLGGVRPADIVGVRLKPPASDSRFGIDFSDYGVFREVARLMQRLPRSTRTGAHFHLASSAIGTRRWWQVFEGIVHLCAAMETASGRHFECLDIGGGWFPDDYVEALAPRLPAITAIAAERLPQMRSFVIELGKALAQPTFAVLATVLEARVRVSDSPEAVIDASVAELPESHSYPHRVLLWERDVAEWRPIGPGHGRILGRLCMEDDVLASEVALPASLRAGDRLLFLDAGGYDRSMSYPFARG